MGRIQLRCNPFSNVKEPECLHKWMLLKLDIMVKSYQATLNFYQKLAPLQEKMLKHIEREIEDIEESDKWKYNDEEQEQEPEEEASDDRDDLDDRLP
jgi:hypothetical protein